MSISKHPADKIVVDLLKAIRADEKPLLLFVSGGSLLPKLQEVFYQLMDAERDYSHVEIALVDERYDKYPHHADSNFTQLMQLTLVPELMKLGMKFTSVLQEDVSLTQTAKAYDTSIKAKLQNPELRTLCILGVGEDFHTAGILPHSFGATTRFYNDLVVGYEAYKIGQSDNPHQERITLTFAAFERMQEVWLYAVGAEKKVVIDEIRQYESKPPKAGYVADKPALFLATLARLVVYAD